MFARADRDGDGKLSKEEWFRVLNSSGCQTSMYVQSALLSYRQQSYREEVVEFFDRMDRDYDGKLSFQEFMGEETPLERLFTSMDKDGDGTVTKEVLNSNCQNSNSATTQPNITKVGFDMKMTLDHHHHHLPTYPPPPQTQCQQYLSCS